jgi:hypothetical protein
MSSTAKYVNGTRRTYASQIGIGIKILEYRIVGNTVPMDENRKRKNNLIKNSMKEKSICSMATSDARVSCHDWYSQVNLTSFVWLSLTIYDPLLKGFVVRIGNGIVVVEWRSRQYSRCWPRKNHWSNEISKKNKYNSSTISTTCRSCLRQMFMSRIVWLATRFLLTRIRRRRWRIEEDFVHLQSMPTCTVIDLYIVNGEHRIDKIYSFCMSKHCSVTTPYHLFESTAHRYHWHDIFKDMIVNMNRSVPNVGRSSINRFMMLDQCIWHERVPSYSSCLLNSCRFEWAVIYSNVQNDLYWLVFVSVSHHRLIDI